MKGLKNYSDYAKKFNSVQFCTKKNKLRYCSRLKESFDLREILSRKSKYFIDAKSKSDTGLLKYFEIIFLKNLVVTNFMGELDFLHLKTLKF